MTRSSHRSSASGISRERHGTSLAFPALCIDGQQTGTSLIEAPRGACRVLGISLLPLAAFALLRTSFADATDRTIDLHDVVGRAAAELGERLAEDRDGAARVATARAWLRDRLARALCVDPIVAALDARIRSEGGNVALATLEAYGGRSRSRIARRFREQIGIGPKRYARIVRFRLALERMNASAPGDSFAAIAHDLGYYDQAHFNVEFRARRSRTTRVSDGDAIPRQRASGTGA